MRRLVALTLLILSPATSTAVGAQVTAPTEAPYVVQIVTTDGHCSGALIDPSHVVTAALCLLDDDHHALPPSAFTVLAGTVSANPFAPGAQLATVDVARVHPAYLATRSAAVGMLHLATPLAETDTVAPIPMVQAVSDLRIPSTATAYGLGPLDADPGARTEVSWIINVTNDICLRGVAGYDCGFFTDATGCNAVRGGPVVQSNPPVLIGILTGYDLDSCRGGRGAHEDLFVDLGVPAVSQWVLGDDTPNTLPSSREPSRLIASPTRGGEITCDPATWRGATSTRIQFFQRGPARMLQSGKSRTYMLQPSDLRHAVACRSYATSPGGWAAVSSDTTVSLVARRAGRYRVCVDPSKGTRRCWWWRPAA